MQHADLCRLHADLYGILFRMSQCKVRIGQHIEHSSLSTDRVSLSFATRGLIRTRTDSCGIFLYGSAYSLYGSALERARARDGSNECRLLTQSVDALTYASEEGRRRLRKASGSCQPSCDPEMSEWGNPSNFYWKQ